MADGEISGLIAAIGVPGFLLFVGYKLAVKYGFFDKDEGSKGSDILKKLDKLSDKIDANHKDAEGEFRGMRDRLTRVETVLEERRGRG